MLPTMEMSKFAMRLQQEIDAKGIDRKTLSRDTEIPYHRIDPWFRRPKSKPRGTDLLIVARYFNVSQDYLMDGGERRPFDPKSSVLAQAQVLDDKSLRELEEFARFLVQRQEQRASEQAQPQDLPASPDQADR
jgi:hypothetical protein